MKIILYTTNCPKCIVLKKKLKNSSIEFIENTNVEEMQENGIKTVPMLDVDGSLKSFMEAVKWINEGK